MDKKIMVDLIYKEVNEVIPSGNPTKSSALAWRFTPCNNIYYEAGLNKKYIKADYQFTGHKGINITQGLPHVIT